jgi:hypothetical protein
VQSWPEITRLARAEQRPTSEAQASLFYGFTKEHTEFTVFLIFFGFSP